MYTLYLSSRILCLWTLTHHSLHRHGDGLSFKQILQTLDDVVDEKELIFFAAVGWGLVPVAKSIHGLYARVTGRRFQDHDEESTKNKSALRKTYEKLSSWYDEESNESNSTSEKNRSSQPFEGTVAFHCVDHVSQASKIGFAVAVVDSMAHIAKLMGFSLQVCDDATISITVLCLWIVSYKK